MKQTNLSIFIPHLGCPNCCSFCNQRYISGQSTPPTENEVRELLSEQAERLERNGMQAEIAFFGGSFTAIDREYMLSLLRTAQEYTEKYPRQYSGIRCSTRPDCIDEAVLEQLKSYGMTAIELGAQSMNDNVLALNDRGHTAGDVEKAAGLIKQYGFSLGLQMMTGLYGDTPESCVETAEKFISLGADTVRIYPTVILHGTKLAHLKSEGRYESFSFDETVDLCVRLLDMFEAADISVIRLGLHASDGVEKEMLGGVYHPALREICESKRIFGRILSEMEKYDTKRFVLYTDKKNISRINGHKCCNKERFSELGYSYAIKEKKDVLFELKPLSADNKRQN